MSSAIALNALASQAASNPHLDEVGYPGLLGAATGRALSVVTLGGAATVDDWYVGAYVRVFDAAGAPVEEPRLSPQVFDAIGAGRPCEADEALHMRVGYLTQRAGTFAAL